MKNVVIRYKNSEDHKKHINDKRGMVWTVSFGETFNRATFAMINSLIKNGKWLDDIFIICDKEIDGLKKFSQVKFCIAKEKISKYGLLPEGRYSAWYSKSTIEDYIDIMEYKSVLFLDSDILIFKDINKFLNNHSLDYFWTQYDDRGDIDTKKCKINSGIIYFDPQRFPNLLKEWRETLTIPEFHKKRFFEQNALRYIVREKYINYLRHFQKSLISGKAKTINCDMTHYFHRHMNNMWKDYNMFVKDDEEVK